MKCSMAVRFMHDYLDHELPRDRMTALQAHLDACPACRVHFEGLTRAEALIRLASSHAETAPPADLAMRIVRSLPAQPRPRRWVTWVRRHPAVSAAAFFLLVMLTSWVATWDQGDRLKVVAGPDAEHLIIEGRTVIVPEGRKVSGDLIVTNGTIRVDGEVEGNVTVIDGNVTLASSAHIAGKIQEIDRAVDWMWYKITSWFGELAYGS